jgi:predicted lysophospholipase L1 biosynthesis ABC-type transport system permease subunit
VIDATSAAASRLSGTHEIWVGSTDPSVESDLTRDGLTILSRVAASERLDTATLTSVLWSLDFTRLLGGVAALIAIGSMLTYFLADRRQRRVADALIQLLGRQDITVASTLIEAGCVLAVAAVTGLVLAAVAALIVVPLLDPLPTAPPELILRFDFKSAGLVILGIALATTACVVAGRTRRPASTIYEAARHDD